MRIVRRLAAPKEGNTPEEYEDAWAVGESTVALCDGASSAMFARQWARLLADSFAAVPFPEKDDAFWTQVAELGRTWRAQVEGDRSKKRAWYAEEKLPQGSAASLLVVEVAGGAWRARALGDVCCFVVRSDRLKYAFPLTKSRHFGNRPSLVPTEPGRVKKKPAVVRFAAAVEPGDRFLLMTDALACWFLAEYEKKRRPWNDLPDESGLDAWLAARRLSGEIKNDDVTLIEAIAPGDGAR